MRVPFDRKAIKNTNYDVKKNSNLVPFQRAIIVEKFSWSLRKSPQFLQYFALKGSESKTFPEVNLIMDCFNVWLKNKNKIEMSVHLIFNYVFISAFNNNIIINNFSRGGSRHMKWFSGRSSIKTNTMLKIKLKR